MNEKINILVSIFHVFKEFERDCYRLSYLNYMINNEKIFIKNPYIRKHWYWSASSFLRELNQAVTIVKTMPTKKIFGERDILRKRRTGRLDKKLRMI